MNKTAAPRKLNLGAGGQVAAGWLNIDRRFSGDLTWVNAQDHHVTWPDNDGGSLVMVHDLTEPWPLPDESADFAVAHHLLDLLEAPDLMFVLREALRVLMPRGVLRISSIDFAKGFEARRDGNVDWFARLGIPAEFCDDAALAFDWWLDWGGARRTLLPLGGARRILEVVGFKVEAADFEETTTLPAICELDSRPDESWFLEARKP